MNLNSISAHNHKLHLLQPQLTPLHSVSFRPLSLSKLQATRCHCCARLRCRPGCGLSCFLHPYLLADARPAPINNQPHKSKKSHQPLFVRPLLHPPHMLWPSHSSHRATFRSYISRSLLTPYLLLADSLRGDPFVRLGRLAIRQSPSRFSRTGPDFG